MTDPGFAYCQARLQARLDRFPSEAEWQRLAAARTLATFLEDARLGPLQTSIKGFSPLSAAHDLERGLRDLAVELVAEVAGWVPEAWRDAVRWTAWLPFLPLFEHLARGQPLPNWARGDYRLKSLCGEDGELLAPALAREGLEPLVAVAEPAAVAVAAEWQQAWRRRWPACPRPQARNLEALERLVARHLLDFRHADPEATDELRALLRIRLARLFHRHLLQPAAVFSYLALGFLDLQRLRGELLGRSLFGGQESR